MVRCFTCNVFHMRRFCIFFYCLAWSETAEFNRQPCPNNEMYGDAVFAIRLRYQLAIIGMRVLISHSRLLHAHIAYEIDTDKIIAAFFRISYCLLNLIRLNSNRLPWSNNKIYDDAVFAVRFRYHLTMFGMCILILLSRILNTHIAHEIVI